MCLFVCVLSDIGNVDLWSCSLQFDPAPRAGEPLVTRRVPDYFLVSGCRIVYFEFRFIRDQVMKRRATFMFDLITYIFLNVYTIPSSKIYTFSFSPFSYFIYGHFHSAGGENIEEIICTLGLPSVLYLRS